MNNEDMSDIIQKLSSMINNSNINNQENTNSSDGSLNSDNSNMNFSDFFNNSNSSNDSTNTNFNFDINTIMKIKNIMDKINSAQNSPETNLLISLKPYLNNNRKQKLDQYMQILNITKALEAFNEENSKENKNV